MAMILDAFVRGFLNKLADVIEKEVAATLHVKGDLRKLQGKLESIRYVLADAERKRIEDAAINNWLAELKDAMYDADDIIDLCQLEGEEYGRLISGRQPSTSLARKVRCGFPPLLSCFGDISFRREISARIKSLNEKLAEISGNDLVFKLQQTNRNEPSGVTSQTSPVPEADVVGRQTADVTRRIAESLVRSDKQSFCVFAITGMGGIGKTTVAQNIYNDQMIKNNFQELIWLCVTQNFSETELLKQIIRNVGGHYEEAVSKSELLPKLRDAVSGKTFLLVLDDVWEGEVWNDLLRNPLASGAGGGSILITTRDEEVAKYMGAAPIHIHRMETMDVRDGWLLLRKKVFGNVENEETKDLKDTGIAIVERCGGLPLAIKAIAGVLRTKKKSKREWEMILQSQAWSMPELPQELRGALYLSYENLPSHLQQCFLYFSLFPAGFTFQRDAMARYWVAEGFIEVRGNSLLEDLAKNYFKELVRRSLLKPEIGNTDEDRCTMHDLIHSLARLLAQNESFLGDVQGLNSTASSKLRHLSIVDNKDISLAPDAIRELKCLRTLMIFQTPVQKLHKDLFKSLKHLRVLNLSFTKIESLPDSIGSLIHLRLLNLDGTNIRELPESIGLLRNLQTLTLNNCRSLCTLPTSYSQLFSLRGLGLIKTQLSHLPKGIERLKHLNFLSGFVVGDSTSEEVQKQSCKIEELQSLSQLRFLSIDKLERISVCPTTLIIKNMTHLNELILRLTPRTHNTSQQLYSEEEIGRIEKVYEKLYPSPSLDYLEIYHYFCHTFPSWMSLSLSTSFPYLRVLVLDDCTCQKLPPLGHLPQLVELQIVGASGVVKIGQEFLGTNVVEGQHIDTKRIAFPKLEIFIIKHMPNWEEWSCGVEDDGSTSASLQHLPSLKFLEITDCPKLRTLPASLLRSTALQRLHIEGAHSLKEIDRFPSPSEWLQLKNNSSLERILNLPTVSELLMINCPAVKHVENLNALQSLDVRDSSTKGLQEWFFALLQQRMSSVNGGLRELYLECNSHLFKECLKGGLYWQTIQEISSVRVLDEHGRRLVYTKTPLTYEAYLR